MTSVQLADNTPLVNFGLIQRIDLLERLLNGRGTWTATVRLECEASSRVPGLESLEQVPRFLGEPLTLDTEQEILLTAEIRERLRIPGDHGEAHLGESESLAIISARSLSASLLTDDMGARREARRLGISTFSTASMLVVAVKVGFISAQDCWDYLVSLRSGSRFLVDAPENFADLLAICGLVG